MRKLSDVVVVALAIASGCGDDGAKPAVDANLPHDDGPIAVVDAAADAAVPVDSTPLACPPAPTTGELAKLTINFATQLANIDVIWSEPDGSIRACTKTDANGKTELRIVPGAMATVVTTRSNGNTTLFTIAGMQPGDDLKVWAPVNLPSTYPVLRVGYPATFPGSGGNFFDIGCDGASYAGTSGINGLNPAPDQNVFAPCAAPDGQHVNIYAEARDPNMPGAPGLAYSVLPNVALAPSGVTAVTMPAWRTDWIDAPLTLVNAPFDILSAYAYVGWVDDGVVFNDTFFRRDTTGGGPGTPAIPAGGGQVLGGRKLPMGLGDEMILELRATALDGYLSSIVVRSPGALGPRTLDLANLLRSPTGITADYTDPARPVVAWQTNASLATADIAQTRLRYGQVDWTVMTAGSETQVKFPALPEDLAPLRPTGPSEGRVNITDNSAFTSYDELRNAGQLFPVGGAGSVDDYTGRSVFAAF